jgi:hypothetical protein
MANLADEIEAFRNCTGPYPYSDFVWLLDQLDYEEVKVGKTSGSRRKFYNKSTKHLIQLHAPHGKEMGSGMVRRLQKELEFRGVI